MRVLVGLMMIALVGTAWAQPPMTARQHYERGTALFDLRRYREAAAEYEAAFELKNEPALLFNIAQAYRAAGDYEAALRSYRAYLRRTGDPPNRAEVERYIGKLEEQREAQRAAARLGASAPAPQPAPPAGPLALKPSAPATRASPTTPVYKKWWLWTAVGVVVAGAATGVALAVTLPRDAPIPAGATTLQFQ
jgi:tetratricopeptide (TPR) repeat protein